MHIFPKEVDRIYSVEKTGHDSTFATHSFQFFDHDGNAGFKAFLWEKFPDVPAETVAAFRELATRLALESQHEVIAAGPP
jgi:putative hemin transport protein